MMWKPRHQRQTPATSSRLGAPGGDRGVQGVRAWALTQTSSREPENCLSKYFILGDPSKKTLHIRQMPDNTLDFFFLVFYFFLFKSTKTI
jgi:hypothetical protein